MNKSSDFRLFTAVSLLAICGTVSSTAAFAQTEEEQIQAQETASTDDSEEIIITGSRIPRRAGFDTSYPATVVNSDQIEQRGITNLGDALDDLPVFGVPGATPIGDATQAGEFGSGQFFVNLYGLGDQRTLTVVNSRRVVSNNTASIFGPTGTNGSQVDFNVFPTMLIDRVEVIGVGGAPVYGSDAIAGTVNVITKRDFEGVKVDTQYGISERGDAAEWRIRGAFGTNFAGGRGNFAISAEYNKADGLRFSDRRHHRLNSFFTSPADPSSPFAQVYVADRRLPSISEFGIPSVSDGFIVLSPDRALEVGPGFGLPPGLPVQIGITDDTSIFGNPLAFDSDGNLVPIDFGLETGGVFTFTSDGGNGFVVPGNLLAERERFTSVALAQYELTDNIRLFGEGWYAHSKGIKASGQPEFNSRIFGLAGQPGGNFIININNPFLSAQARSIIQANLANNFLGDDPTGQTFLLGRANTDIISGVASATVDVYRFVGGVDGDFEAFGRDMRFELVSVYGSSKTKGNGRAIVHQNLLNALNAVAGPNGSIVCAPHVSSPMPTISSTCAPLNPFGHNVSQAARDYVTAVTNPEAKNTQWVTTASVSGSLFDLPGGAVDFVLGYEHRKETAKLDPGTFFTGGPDPDPLTDSNGDGNPANDRVPFGQSVVMDPVSGSFNTDEFFAELKLPIISPDQDITLIRSFEINGAFRYINHSMAGSDPTYTIGANWQPFKAITIRGNYTRSVRSPAITEFFNPRSSVFNFADDPCDQRFVGAGPNPSVRQANCASQGLGPNFVSSIVDASQQGTFSGNPDLVNETADSWTVGVIVRPVPRMIFSADWVNIKVKGAVEALDFTNVLNACYDSPDFPDASTSSGTEFCNLFTRNLTGTALTNPRFGQILTINSGFENAASRHFRGLQAELQWTLPTPFLGKNNNLNIGVNYLYTDKLDLVIGTGDLEIIRDSIGQPKHAATANLTYQNGGLAWQWQAQYIGKTRNDPNVPDSDFEFPTISDVIFFNTSVSYLLNDRFRVLFTIENVFDKKPPFPVPAAGGVTTYFDGILGRYFKIGAGIQF